MSERVVVTGTVTVTFLNEVLLRSFVEEQARQTEERKAFLEKFSGLPVVVIDEG